MTVYDFVKTASHMLRTQPKFRERVEDIRTQLRLGYWDRDDDWESTVWSMLNLCSAVKKEAENAARS